MAIDLCTVFNDIVLDVEDSLDVAKGKTSLAAWADLPMVDLGTLTADFDFETPGLHKRARACLGAVLSRSGDNVGFEWAQRCISSSSGYSDYDRLYTGKFWTTGSTWGSSRGAAVRITWAKHVTNGGSITDWPQYVSGMGLFGIGTDSEGNPAVAFRLFLAADSYERAELHSQVKFLWGGLVGLAMDNIVERLLNED